jgi:hypothetical protein
MLDKTKEIEANVVDEMVIIGDVWELKMLS